MTIADAALAHIHWETNTEKFSGFFTGFLEGIVSSGGVEQTEIEPLLHTCAVQLQKYGDEDAFDILEDFKCDLLSREQLLDAIQQRAPYLDMTEHKVAMNRFMGFCAAIACDDIISLSEAKALVEWYERSELLQTDPVCRTIHQVAYDALEDGEISSTESDEICEVISNLVGDSYASTGVTALEKSANMPSIALRSTDDLAGKVIVLTGKFSITPRSKIANALEAFGATTKSAPCSKTDYVLVASQCSRDWIYTHKGTKLVKALKLQDETGKPEFLSEFPVLKLLNL